MTPPMETVMLTTLSILSLDQGKIAPRYDLGPKSPDEAAEALVLAGVPAPASWPISQVARTISNRLFVRITTRNGGTVSHA